MGLNVIKAAAGLVDLLRPSPSQAAALNAAEDLAAAQISQPPQNGQIGIFWNGWRPATGWACAIGFAVQAVAMPLIQSISTALGHPVDLPPADWSEVVSMLGGLLGLGTLRTIEKKSGVAS